jgi:hypothetical protein
VVPLSSAMSACVEGLMSRSLNRMFTFLTIRISLYRTGIKPVAELTEFPMKRDDIPLLR